MTDKPESTEAIPGLVKVPKVPACPDMEVVQYFVEGAGWYITMHGDFLHLPKTAIAHRLVHIPGSDGRCSHETREILADPNLMHQIEKSEKDIREGKVTEHCDVCGDTGVVTEPVGNRTFEEYPCPSCDRPMPNPIADERDRLRKALEELTRAIELVVKRYPRIDKDRASVWLQLLQAMKNAHAALHPKESEADDAE